AQEGGALWGSGSHQWSWGWLSAAGASRRTACQKADGRTARTRYHSARWVSIADAEEQEGSVLRKRVASVKIFIALIAAISLAGITLAAQTAAPGNGKMATPPRSSDGHPDLSGIWEHNAATPLERPDELADRATLTDDEIAQLKAKAAELFSGDGDAGFGDSIYLAALHNILGKEKGFKSR